MNVRVPSEPESVAPCDTHASTPGAADSIPLPTVVLAVMEACAWCDLPYAVDVLTPVHGHGRVCWPCLERERELGDA